MQLWSNLNSLQSVCCSDAHGVCFLSVLKNICLHPFFVKIFQHFPPIPTPLLVIANAIHAINGIYENQAECENCMSCSWLNTSSYWRCWLSWTGFVNAFVRAAPHSSHSQPFCEPHRAPRSPASCEPAPPIPHTRRYNWHCLTGSWARCAPAYREDHSILSQAALSHGCVSTPLCCVRTQFVSWLCSTSFVSTSSSLFMLRENVQGKTVSIFYMYLYANRNLEQLFSV